ncbi:uncharacterized protein RB166_005689 [Leptodactylus fuscus]
MGTLENPQKFHNQDFDTLREWHLKKRVLFTDESFPANMNSIGSRLKNEFNTHNIEWKRPTEICAAPHFVVDGVSLFDILQSRLGDCWVLSAIGSITLKPELLQKIMPLGQGYSVGYAGIFHFRFWHLGEWVDVVIDDKLPFLDGKYLSVRPSCENEFWPCLLEKAYAKFLGSYQNLHWGDPAEAFVNLTGGLTMTFNLKSPEAHTYWNMISMASPDTLMACISDKKDCTTRNQSIYRKSYAGSRRCSCINSERPLPKYNISDETQIYMVKEHGQGHLEEITDFCAPEEIQIFKLTENGQSHLEEIGNDYAPEEIHTCNDTENRQDHSVEVKNGNTPEENHTCNVTENRQNHPEEIVNGNAPEEIPTCNVTENKQDHKEKILNGYTPEEIPTCKVTEIKQDHPEEIVNGNTPEEIPTCNVTENGQVHPEVVIQVNTHEEIPTCNVTEIKQAHPEETLNSTTPEENHTYFVKEHDRKLRENALLANGLVERHAYSITDFAEVNNEDVANDKKPTGDYMSQSHDAGLKGHDIDVPHATAEV